MCTTRDCTPGRLDARLPAHNTAMKKIKLSLHGKGPPLSHRPRPGQVRSHKMGFDKKSASIVLRFNFRHGASIRQKKLRSTVIDLKAQDLTAICTSACNVGRGTRAMRLNSNAPLCQRSYASLELGSPSRSTRKYTIHQVMKRASMSSHSLLGHSSCYSSQRALRLIYVVIISPRSTRHTECSLSSPISFYHKVDSLGVSGKKLQAITALSKQPRGRTQVYPHHLYSRHALAPLTFMKVYVFLMQIFRQAKIHYLDPLCVG